MGVNWEALFYTLAMSDAFLESAFALELCEWFARVRRDLPWRRTEDPYAIWISEVMLQQTRVETVIEAYGRFLAAFPDVRALARADEDEVLALWSGLGYYRRARALHRASREIVERFDGEFPTTRDELLTLSGVGRYTAGAVLSIAFGANEPLVDGNVARVFSRWFLLEDPLGSGALDRALWNLAERMLPPAGPRGQGANPGDWNQALMELGATVCKPTSPACGVCPAARHCRAYAVGRAEELPKKKPKRAPTPVTLEMLLVRSDEAVLLVQRPKDGRMAGLWEPPTREVETEHLWPTEFETTRLASGYEIEERVVLRLKHSITRYAIEAHVALASATGAPDPAGAPARWFRSDELARVGLTGLAKKVLRRAPLNQSPA